MVTIRVSILLVFAASTGPLGAQEAGFARAFFQYDQDGWHANWLAAEQDHAYTGGFQGFISFHASPIDRLGESVFWSINDVTYAAGVGLKFRVFTPENVTTVSDPGPDERPYAGWMTTSFALQQRNAHFEDQAVLELGLVGPKSGAARLQRSIHPALGWETQLENELTFNLRLRRAWRVPVRSGGERGVEVRLVPQLSADVGTVYRRATGGVTLRLGFRVPDDFVLPRIDDPGSLSGQVERWSAFAFVRGATHAVQHNLFLDGQGGGRSRSVLKEPIVGEVEVGAMLQFGPRAAFQWSWTAITDEFETDPVNDSYGTLSIRFHF